MAAAIIPDTVGPLFASVEPSGLILDPFDHLRITFNEPVDASSFSLDDILSLTGPDGDIGPLALQSVAGSSNRVYEITFASQSAPGDYKLVVSPNITDRFGNLIDANGNGIGGEFPGDELMHGFVKADALARFDFGNATSPVAANYTKVTGGDRYDAAVGYGWQTGSVYSLERGSEPLTGDFNYTAEATFAIDLPNGEYDVIATMGEAIVSHDQMGVFLEGVQVDSVTTAAGQFAVNTYRASVSDGQLSVGFRDLGGSNPWVNLNGLDIVFAGPDLTGPRVTSTDATGVLTGPIDRIHVTFSEPLQVGSFTLEDIEVLEGPVGPVTPLAVQLTSNGDYEITFEPVNESGPFTFRLGSSIADVTGNLMDQDEDGISGEVIDDRFETSFTLEAGPEIVARYDFGTSTSPVASGYTRVTGGNRYDASAGYGWQTGSVYSLERGGEPLTADFNYTTDATFAIDLPNGEYDVIVTMGETIVPHDQMGIFLEGVQVDSVSTAAGEFAVNTYRTSVADGQLSLGVRDLGGTNPWVNLNGLVIVYAGPDLTGPMVTATDATGVLTGPIDRIQLTFSEPLQEGSFTLDDIETFEGPSKVRSHRSPSRPMPMVITKSRSSRSTNRDRSRFAFGSNIADVAGNLMDQDQDGIGGEPVDDRFETTFTLEDGPEIVGRLRLWNHVITGCRWIHTGPQLQPL